MAQIPESVKIGHYKWAVKAVDEMPGEGSHWGETDHEAMVIRVKGTLPEPHLTVTVVHEVFHAALVNCGINDHDELHVNALSMRLVEILRDNPALVDLIKDGTE